ncbi:ferredoxin [Candidatus Nomurabacteria bacterium]|nr:ferredoxin [Candidatus Nomurabacteria bacterium]
MTPQELLEKNNKIADENTDIAKPDDLSNFDDISQGVRVIKEGDIKRIVVDRQGCIGARSCVVVAEDVFKMDEMDLAYIDDPEAYDDDTVKLAAEACPVLAIHLYDGEGKKIFPEE